MIKQRTPEWASARKKLLSASDFGAALGINPFCTRQKLWRLKIGLEVVSENEHIRRGTEQEPVAVFAYEVERGVLVDEAGLVLHPDEPWLGASPDGFVGADGLIEVKAPATVRHEVPPYHYAQIQGQMEIADRGWCDYAQWCDGELHVKRIARDRVWWDNALPKLREFWDYVLRMDSPPRKRNSK